MQARFVFCFFLAIAGLAAAAPVTPFVQLATTQRLDDGAFAARLEDAPEMGAPPVSALFDGIRATASEKSQTLKLASGETVKVQLSWKDGCCATAVRVAFSGDVAVSLRWAEFGGAWHEPILAAPVALLDKAPHTSYFVWENFAWNAAQIEITFAARSNGEITDIEVPGFEHPMDGPFLCVRRDANLPAVNQAVRLDAACYNPTAAALPAVRLLVDEAADGGESRQAAEAELPAIAPGTAASVPVLWIAPSAPGPYQVLARCLVPNTAEPLCQAASAVHVTQPKLHFVWYGEPEATGYTTALTTIGDNLDAYDWRRQGVLPLSWAPGMCHRGDTQAEFERDWSSRIEGKGRGIAIDEFGVLQSGEFGIGMANALFTIRRRFPDAPVYVWQAMITNESIAPALRRAADLILHECYMEYMDYRYPAFDFMVARIREFGLTHNSVFGLDCTHEKAGTTPGQLTEQFRYIRELAPELPGVAIYKAYGSGAALVSHGDWLFERYFLGPVLRVVLVRDAPNKAIVQNIGQTAARDVDLELLGLPDGKTAAHKTIPLLLPGESALAEWKLAFTLPDDAQVRIVEKPRYVVVSPPKPER